MRSLLDNDLYKLTMQQAVFSLYPNAVASCKFKNRNPNIEFTQEFTDILHTRINNLESLSLTPKEHRYLQSLPIFKPDYLNFLTELKLTPKKHITISNNDGDLQIIIKGPWREIILYEVPLLSLITETYFEHSDKDWKFDEAAVFQNAYKKGEALIENGCVFSEFGTRRRRSFDVHEKVVQGLIASSEKTNGVGCFAGTSNVYFAMKYSLPVVGTVAHEWIMAVSELEGDLLHANRNAMKAWLEVYPKGQSIALCDTFGTRAFLKDFDEELAGVFDGVRQDSGDPMEFTDLIVEHYNKLGIDPSTKSIIFSDSLNVEKCITLKKYCQEKKIQCKFGVGTYLTNDFMKISNATIKSKPLDIVIKIQNVDGMEVVKLSDSVGKSQGDLNALKKALKVFDM